MPQPLKVLIVEDNPVDAELVLRELRRLGFAPEWQRVDTEPAFIEQLRAGLDLILSDYEMPQFGGLRALELLKQSGLEVPFIIVSGTIGEDTAVEAMKLGASDYLLKDRLARLGQAVNQVLEQSRSRRERKVAAAAARESEERFRQVVENINEVFWMTDMDKNQMLYISPAYEKIWGRTCESLYQAPRNWVEAIYPEDREAMVAAMLTKQIRGDYDETFRIMRPDGSIRWIHDKAFPIRDQAGRVYRVVGTAEDITEHHQMEAQFRQAQKMEAIGTLAGGIAHDFNNILGAIIGYAELTKMKLKDNPSASEYLGSLLQGAHRAAALVRQILAFSRQQQQQRSLVQLRHLVVEPLNLLRATIPSTIVFEAVLASDLPAVLADATQVHQVVMNLCTNAWHAMKDRPGRLEVRLDRFDVDAHLAQGNPNLHVGPYVRLTVSDTGHGMDRATMERIFEPFFTTKPLGEGTGLGLSAVHGIMKSHDGAVTVYSQPGEGTTFHLYFPAQDAEADKVVDPAIEVPRGRGESVLFVDDEKPLALLGRAMLEELGYTVTICNNPTEALSIVREKPAKFALVITDLTMPVMTGADLAVQLREIRTDLPVILTTGYTASLTPERIKAL
ncbi:MAG TPA: response regulator, partial [Lacunisphaera sp.]|nr:response regulator [Lacunisphaera sp.]